MWASEHHETWLDKIQKGSYALLSDDREVNTAVIFVHGFLGDAESTWVSFQELICSTESEFAKDWSRCDAFFYAYPSFHDDITYNAARLLKFITAIFPSPPADLLQENRQRRYVLPQLEMEKAFVR